MPDNTDPIAPGPIAPDPIAPELTAPEPSVAAAASSQPPQIDQARLNELVGSPEEMSKLSSDQAMQRLQELQAMGLPEETVHFAEQQRDGTVIVELASPISITKKVVGENAGTTTQTITHLTIERPTMKHRAALAPVNEQDVISYQQQLVAIAALAREIDPVWVDANLLDDMDLGDLTRCYSVVRGFFPVSQTRPRKKT